MNKPNTEKEFHAVLATCRKLYDEKKVIDYTRKISKELKELPHDFGATLGYSMIEDDIKTIDDAINEATLSMRQAKEKL